MGAPGTSAALDRPFPALMPNGDRLRHPDAQRTVPRALVQPHEQQALHNHSRGLCRLADRFP